MKSSERNSVSLRIASGILFMAFVLSFIFITLRVEAQWNNNTAVNELIATLPVADMHQVPTSDGKTWIAFYNAASNNYNMRAQLIDANGFKLLGDDGILVDGHTSGSATYVFNVCVDSANNLVIAMQDERSGTDKAVMYKISPAGNQLWGADGIVLGLGLAPYPAVLSMGEVVVAWNESNSNTLKLQKITTGGTAAWTSPISILVGSTATTMGQPVGCTSGKFTVVYQKRGVGINSYLYSQMFDNSGNALYSPLQLSTQATAAVRYYSVQAEDDTVFVGYFASPNTRFNSFLQRINPDGTIPWGNNGSNFNTHTGTNDSFQGPTSINFTPGSNYVWAVCTFSNPNQTQYGVYVQKFLKTTGARQFSDYAKSVYAISSNMDTQDGDLALVSDAPMFMSYNSVYKIYATRLDGSGNFVWPGNNVILSSTTANQGSPKGRYGFTPIGPNRCAGSWTEDRGVGDHGYIQGISVGGLIGLVVATQGNVPAVITTNGGTLQMVDTVFPATANQNVTWSIVPGTGMATISGTGLVTAVSNGTAYAKAIAVQDTTVMDSLMITISNQVAAPPTVVTLPATNISSSGATLNGSVNANTLLTNVSFDWGLTSAYGNNIAAVPPTVSGTNDTAVQAVLTGLQSYTTYHFRIKGVNLAGTSAGEDLIFTTLQGVGVNEKEPLKIEVYPVPNDGHFNISVSSSTETSCKLDIYNNLGLKVLGTSTITVNGNTVMPVDLGSLPGGVYTIILGNTSGRFERKIVVDK